MATRLASSLTALLALSLALAGCGGGSKESSSTTTGQTTGTGTGATTEVVTYTQVITESGRTTTITSTTTQTATSGSESQGPIPVIGNVTETPASNSAAIMWEVSGGTAPLSSSIEYGTESLANYSATSPAVLGDGELTTTIGGLSSCTDYKYRVSVHDGADVIVNTDAHHFKTTSGPALAITAGPTVTEVLDTSLTIQYTLAGPDDAKSHIDYGTSPAYGSSTPEVDGNGVHTIVIAGLAGGQDYNYRIAAGSPCGSQTFANQVQKTAIVLHVDINANSAVAGTSLNSYTPGSTATGGAIALALNTPYVFDVTNKETSPGANHEFHITDSAGISMSPSYSSGTVAPGSTYHFLASIKFTTAGTYHMKCSIHSTMSGDLTLS